MKIFCSIFISAVPSPFRSTWVNAPACLPAQWQESPTLAAPQVWRGGGGGGVLLKGGKRENRSGQPAGRAEKEACVPDVGLNRNYLFAY